VIVRISGEGQYRLPEDALAEVNALDNAAVDAAQAGDEARFTATFRELLELVRQRGEVLAGDDLSTSDVILPPPDTTIEEAAEVFTGDGLIPD
jgi:hypothetical protein